MSKKIFNLIIVISVGFLINSQVFANTNDNNATTKPDLVMHETFQLNPDVEMLVSHEFYKGIKIKGIRIKQVEIHNDTAITKGNVVKGEPNRISFVIELTDMKGKIIEIYGSKTLGEGDYTYIIEHD